MVTINLLPWRQAFKQELQVFFLLALALAATASSVILLMTHLWLSQRLNAQLMRNSRYAILINEIDRSIAERRYLEQQKSELISKINMLQQLKMERSRVIHLFNEFIRITPAGVCLTQINRVNSKITLKGISESNTFIAQFMRSIDQSPVLLQPILNEIRPIDNNLNSTVNQFGLELGLRSDNNNV